MNDVSSAKPQNRGSCQRILEAANKLFTEKGYTETTTRMIASAAQVNEATIFHHFHSKAELFRTVYLTNTPDVTSLHVEGLTNGQNLQQDLYLLFREYTLIYIKHIPYYKLSVQQVDKQLGKEFYRTAASRLEGMKIHLLTYLNSLKSANKIVDIDCIALSEFLFSIFLIKAPEFIQDKGPNDIYNTQLVEQFVNAYVDYVYRLIAVD